ncbi:type VI secretion system tip protein VgrG [Orbus wheelerorum]|uniref:type VI secretion system Vgr family protein n=1 Tax=Orbus wheelerorum TaxID=3074111 RepID=UPI00370D4827
MDEINFATLLGNNHYTLTIDQLDAATSVLAINSHEALNQLWCYEVIFTSENKLITIESVLSQKASLIFQPKSLLQNISKISSLDRPLQPRTLYGVVTKFSQIAINKEQAQYCIILEPRLATLKYHHYSAIYQQQSIVTVVEEVLRRHGFTGVDYRLELKETYPTREFISQWQENDLEFIQRILFDVGIWFRFENHSQHACDVVVISDYEQGLVDKGNIIYKEPTGTLDGGVDSVWNLTMHSQTVTQSVLVQDYNYRQAQSDMQTELNSQPKNMTTQGINYHYGEHYKVLGDEHTPESGKWYACIRHQQQISEQVQIIGHSNDYQLSPGQRINIIGHPLAMQLPQGIIIISIEGNADRTQSYALTFTAIVFDVLKPYRPTPISWPQVNGTIPAKVTSPDNDTYGYIDTQGRYRVKLDYDLKTWKKGEESLWVRLAKPYAGDTYGFHFPLIDGTGVAIGFTGGNPDRPYIAHALHDSTHLDHVTTENKHRNVIRTPANNKLRMDDKRGQEHIKLATQYGKSQLNLGHLVDNEKIKRGEGFELRTDEWGVIRAGKGVYVTSYKREGTDGVKKASLDADETVSLLKTGLSVSQRLSKRSASHLSGKLEGSDSFNLFVKYTASETANNISFTEPSMVLSSPKGIATVTPDNIYQYAEQNILLTSKQDTNIAADKSVNVSAGSEYSVFAKQDIKLFSGEAKIQLQAHNGDIELIADKSLKVISNDDSIDINAKKEITIACGGAYIRIANGNIELYAPGLIKHGAQGFPFSGPKNMVPTLYSFPKQQPLAPYLKQFILVEDGTDKPIINREYQILNKNNQVITEGKTDAQGKTEIVSTGYEEAEVIFKYKNN